MIDQGGGETNGIADAGRDVARHLAALASARLELVSLEWAIERERIGRRLALMLAGVILLVLGIFTLTTLVILYFWESHRMAALFVAGLVCSVAGTWLILRPGANEMDGGLPFAATRAEFDKDRAAFFATDGTRFGEMPGGESAGQDAVQME